MYKVNTDIFMRCIPTIFRKWNIPISILDVETLILYKIDFLQLTYMQDRYVKLLNTSRNSVTGMATRFLNIPLITKEHSLFSEYVKLLTKKKVHPEFINELLYAISKAMVISGIPNYMVNDYLYDVRIFGDDIILSNMEHVCSRVLTDVGLL